MRALVDPVPLLFLLVLVAMLARLRRTTILQWSAFALAWSCAAPLAVERLHDAWSIGDTRDPSLRYDVVVPLAGMVALDRARTPAFDDDKLGPVALFNDNVERLLVAVRLLREDAAARLLYADVRVAGVQEAPLVDRLLQQMGIPEGRRSAYAVVTSTRDEAVGLARRLGDGNEARVLVVTSRLHLRRALATMRRAGLDADGVGVGEPPPLEAPPLAGLLPSAKGFSRMRELLYEVVGFAVYAVRGHV